MNKNFEHVFINGCSHSAGSEIAGSSIGDGDDCRNGAFGAKLAKKLNVPWTNIAMPGASNDYIFRTTFFWLNHNIELAKKSLFLIHWTGSARCEYFHDGGVDNPFMWHWNPFVPDPNVGHLHPGYHGYVPKHFSKNATKICNTLFENEFHWEVNRYLNIIYLQNFLKVHNIPYIFRNAFGSCASGERYGFYEQQVDQTRYVGMQDTNQSFFEHCLDNGFSIEGQLYMHHKEDAHDYWAEKLFNENFA